MTDSAALIGYFAISSAIVGMFCCGFTLAANLYFHPRWKEGFDEGYEMAKKHFSENQP